MRLSSGPVSLSSSIARQVLENPQRTLFDDSRTEPADRCGRGAGRDVARSV